jgi:hypothetical protein
MLGFNFFLYGAYGEDQPCFARFKNFIRNSQPAVVCGTMYKLQCGLSLLVNEGEGTVSGLAVELDIPETQWPIFDAINGCQLEPASTKNFIVKEKLVVQEGELQGARLDAYCLNPHKKLQTLGPILGGSMAPATNFDLLSSLTVRQKTYIQKLAKVKGREVVPIDLAVSRELIAMQLIVDKGRRLALTNLGQEVSCFL